MRFGIYGQLDGRQRFRRRVRNVFDDSGILHFRQPVRQHSALLEQSLRRRVLRNVPDGQQPHLRRRVGLLHVQQPVLKRAEMRQQQLCEKIVR